MNYHSFLDDSYAYLLNYVHVVSMPFHGVLLCGIIYLALPPGPSHGARARRPVGRVLHQTQTVPQRRLLLGDMLSRSG